jgi:hypothetical protein
MKKCGHLLLRDTRGNFYLGIRLPTPKLKDRYKHGRAQYFREYQKRPGVRQRHRILTREWKKKNPEKVKQSRKKWTKKNPDYNRNYKREWKKHLSFEKWEYYRNQKNEYMRAYYRKNRKRIMANSKKWYHNNKKK